MADHYFTAQPSSEADEHTVSYRARGIEYSVTASDGVFSSHGLDKGTAVLLDKVSHTDLRSLLSDDPSDHNDYSSDHARTHTDQESQTLDHRPLCVDVGCGWGPITFALANEYPHARVIGVDVNERALDLARRNAAALDLANVSIMHADAALRELGTARDDNQQQLPCDGVESCDGIAQHTVPQRVIGPIDLIWSNPPIRIGKAALHQLLIQWLPLLTPGTGEAYWVVQKNLGADSLTTWLNEQGFPSEKVGSSKGFRVIRSRNVAPAQC